MFDQPGPRLFGIAPGVDYPRALIDGILARLPADDPAALARVEIFVNSERMKRRLEDLLHAGPARLLPRIRLLTRLTSAIPLADLPDPMPPLQRQLELAQLIGKLLDQQPDLAPRSAIFDLAGSLAALMDEIQSEGVNPDTIQNLDLGHLSEYWRVAQSFLRIAQDFSGDGERDPEARNRIAAERLIDQWQANPPQHPIILAGSTGSRGTTALLMKAAANLPHGAVVLPGFDAMTPDVWQNLRDAAEGEDHPQYRFEKLMSLMGLNASDVANWEQDAVPPCPARNNLISLALRPAPVTDQWLTEGVHLTDLDIATQDVTLIEAPSPRAEAQAIALTLRKAVSEGVPAALISPDRMLTRQVTAALDRWGIEPDDSAGSPLHHSAPGRLLLQLTGLFGRKITSEHLLALLKHPLLATGSDLRGPHLLWTRELELTLRRNGVMFPSEQDLTTWAAKSDDGRASWAIWLNTCLNQLNCAVTEPVLTWLTRLNDLAEMLCAGPNVDGSGGLWDKVAGTEARNAINDLKQAAPSGGHINAGDFARLLHGVLSARPVHDPVQPHPGVMIWGTLEARVQGAELVILGGLNEGSWPSMPAPDPWLSRDMRAKTGLLMPERRVGLAAHDFQQAVAAPKVVLSRAIRDAESETVPSRWINRLTNLLSGLPDQNGPEVLRAMRARGDEIVAQAALLDAPSVSVPPAPRPSPCPPAEMRPGKLSVTRIATLIRDPYAIYAERVLKLRALDPLYPEPSAPMRGTVLHKLLELAVKAGPDLTRAGLLSLADQVLAVHAPWAATRAQWRARVDRFAEWFLSGEAARRAAGEWIALETKGAIKLESGFELTAEADRIDRLNDGRLQIFDYKTGTPPSAKQMEEFDKQLLLEAVIAEMGGFGNVPRSEVAEVTYLGLGSTPKTVTNTLQNDLLGDTWQGLNDLIERYQNPELGYTARRAIALGRHYGDYDHLSRFGEWDDGQPAQRIKVTP